MMRIFHRTENLSSFARSWPAGALLHLRRLGAATGLALCLAWAAPDAGRAQMPVIDPANLAQSVLQAARALEQIHHQVRQIEQQALMLARSPLDLSPELAQSVDEARALFATARGIAFEVERLSADLRALYPETFAAFGLEEVGAQSARWLAEDRAAIERALRAQAQAAASLQATRARIGAALAASASAQGQTGAAQAGNQLLGVNAAQLAEIHALLIAQGRALATERLERVAREARAIEIQRRAFPGAPVMPARAAAPARSAFGS